MSHAYTCTYVLTYIRGITYIQISHRKINQLGSSSSSVVKTFSQVTTNLAQVVKPLGRTYKFQHVKMDCPNEHTKAMIQLREVDN